MKKLVFVLALLIWTSNCFAQSSKMRSAPLNPHLKANSTKSQFVGIQGQDLIEPSGDKFLIKGINLANWLNPEGYMMLLGSTAGSYRHIDEGLKEMVGENVVDEFWRDFQKYYITQEDIKYIRKTGMNTVRLPFHYKMLTNEPFMGHTSKTQGYAMLDSVIKWCAEEGLYVILDMHTAPGGQTGINIDDSYGYPWLLTTEKHKQEFCQIWQEISTRYANNSTVLAYDLLNEPIASDYFPEDTTMLNEQLENLFHRVIKKIRQVDKNHIVMVSGSKWGQDYSIFKSWDYDDKLMFTCHRYHSDTTTAGIQDFLDYRKKFNRPFYMGETGQEPDEWIADFRRMLEKENIGWTFWPYKKMGREVVANEKPSTPWGTYSRWSTTSMLAIKIPQQWQLILQYTAANRSDYESIRKNRPSQDQVRAALAEFIHNLKYKNCTVNKSYIKALGMNP